MFDHDEYRRQANFCERMAQQATAPELKESWLRLAADWLGMIPGHPATPEEQFDAAAQAKGTHQKDSTSSH
jgi:hypothetical protein